MNFLYSATSFPGYILDRLAAKSLWLSKSAPISESIAQIFITLIVALFIVFFVLLLKWWRTDRKKLRELENNFDSLSVAPAPSAFRAAFGAGAGAFMPYLAIYKDKTYSWPEASQYVANLWEPRLPGSVLPATVGSLLTGLGVLGTFVGLLLGLGGLHLDGAVSELQNEIKGIASGASMAFETSVWGVALSLIYTFIEKILISRLQESLSRLERRASEKLPPLPSWAIAIANQADVAKSRNLLANLASRFDKSLLSSLEAFSDKISATFDKGLENAGKRLSNSINAGIGQALNENLAPHIERLAQITLELADRQARNAEEALRRILDDFTGKLYEAGREHHESLKGVSEATRGHLQEFNQQITLLIEELQTKQVALVSAQHTQLTCLEETFARINGGLDRFLEDCRQEYDNHVTASRKIIEQAKKLYKVAEEDREKMADASAALMEASLKLHEASDVLRDFAADIHASLETQSRLAGDMSDGLDRQAAAQASSIESLKKMLEQVADLNSRQEAIALQQQSNLGNLETGFDNICKQQATYLKDIETVLGAYAAKGEALLAQGRTLHDLANQERDKMDKAATSFVDFAHTMANATQDLESFGAKARQTAEMQTEAYKLVATMIQSASDSQHHLVEEFKGLFTRFQPILRGIEDVSSSLEKTSQSSQEKIAQLASISAHLQEVFNKYLHDITLQTETVTSSYGEQLKSLGDQLDEAAGKLFDEFSRKANEQLNERMSAWNMQTRDFCNSMNNTVNVMAEIMKEFDSGNKLS